MAIGIRSYFHKIADPADIASSSGVAFSINHIAAVIIPVLFGILWLTSPAAVFLAGAIMALISLRGWPTDTGRSSGFETTLIEAPLSENS